MVGIVYSELNEPKKNNLKSTNVNIEAFRENLTPLEYNDLKDQLEKDPKYDYKDNILLYTTPLPPNVNDVYNSDLNEVISQQNYLYIVGLFSMGVLLVYAINLARN